MANWPVWATEQVEVRPAGPEWQRLGEGLARELDVVLACWLVAPVEHVGLTAVPGLAAKPILDLQAAVADLDCVQRMLGPTWMSLGVDDLIRALPGGDELDDLLRAQRGVGEPVGAEGSIQFAADGSIALGERFRRAEASWYAGLAAIGRCGTGLIIDEVFMGGRASQERLAAALSDLPVLWVGVRASHPAVGGDACRGGDRRWALAWATSPSAGPPICVATHCVRPRGGRPLVDPSAAPTGEALGA